MSISRAFDPPAVGALPGSVAQSVQSSLWQRLKPTYRDRAGDLAWLLVRLGQPDHREHGEACDAIMARPASELAALSGFVGAAPRGPRSAEAAALVAVILEVLMDALASQALRARAAK